MAQLYFHCSGPERVVPDRSVSDLEDWVEAHAHAIGFVQRIVAMATAEDWRAWKLQVIDEEGDQVFEVPFASVIGRLH
jgi:Domain of unknown function (DUF6894)